MLSCAFLAFFAGVVSFAHANRDRREVMTMDHHLVQSDFVGVITVERVTQDRDGATHLVRIDDVWESRWGVGVGDSTTIPTGPQVRPLLAGARYVVLLAGGAWHQSPFTHRMNSVFRLEEDGNLRCDNGLTLYGAFGDGFYCSIPELVIGEAPTLDEIRTQTVRQRRGAVLRHPDLAERLDRQARPHELSASPHATEDIRR